MNINATIVSATGKVIIIASKDDDTGFPRVVETTTPKFLRNWDVEPWVDCLEIRCAYNNHRWGLEKHND